MTAPLAAVGVIVPACNEELTIEASLRAVLVSLDALSAERPSLLIRAVCVADSCTDATLSIARTVADSDAPARLTVTEVNARRVGLTRGAGCEEFLRQAGSAGVVDLESIWMATTDADSLVGERWALEQARAADAGVDCLVGTVEPVASPPDIGSDAAEILERWHARHALEEGHPYVFGANLGVRASAYRAVGGFSPLPHGEDVALVAALRESGWSVESTDRHRVLTSTRTQGRVADGFSTYLRELSPRPPRP
jgi:glycosyltransferase involved in cell wall biosynthesis